MIDEQLLTLKKIIKEECAYKTTYAPDEPFAALNPQKTEHFIKRFIERFAYDEIAFRRLIRAFIGMLQVRRKFYVDYVNKNPSLNEHVYHWRGYEINFTTTRGSQTQLDSDGKCAVIILSTLIYKG